MVNGLLRNNISTSASAEFHYAYYSLRRWFHKATDISLDFARAVFPLNMINILSKHSSYYFTGLHCLGNTGKAYFFLTRSFLPTPLYTYSMLQACLLRILLQKSYALMKLQAFFNTFRIVGISRGNWYNSLILTLHPCLKQYHKKKKKKCEHRNFQKLVLGK